MIATFVGNLVMRRSLVNNKNGVFISECMPTRGFCLSPVDVAVYPELASCRAKALIDRSRSKFYTPLLSVLERSS